MDQELLERKPGETDDDIILRVSLHKDKIGTWQDIADALNAILNTNRSAEAYRHAYRRAKDSRVPTVPSAEQTVAEYLDDFYFAKQRQKIRDERSVIARYARNEARLEARLDEIERTFRDIKTRLYPNRSITNSSVAVDNPKGMVVMLSDWHIGMSFNSPGNSFNKEIAIKRITQLQEYCQYYAKLHGVQQCAVVLMGDMISGNIHQSIILENQMNVVEQLKMACNLLADFIYELSLTGIKIDVYSIAGNHTRLGKKEDVLTDERLDNFICWFLYQVLHGTNHIKVHMEQENDTITLFELLGKKYVIVHGDYDENSPQGISRLILYCQEIPFAILTAHKHTPSINMVNDIYVIQGGCLSGSGDNFTKEKRLNGKAYQMILIDDGEQLIGCPVKLN